MARHEASREWSEISGILFDQGQCIGLHHVFYAKDVDRNAAKARGVAILWMLESLKSLGLWFRDYHEFTRHGAGLSVKDIVESVHRLGRASDPVEAAKTDPVMAPFDLIARSEWRKIQQNRLRASGL